MSIRRWQPRKTSTPIPNPPHRRSRLGLAVLGACILLAGLFGLRAYNAPKPTLRAAPAAPVSPSEPWTKAIKDVVEGDWVLARDEETGELAPQQVTRVFQHTTYHLRVLDILAADGQATQEIQTTDEHPFWVEGRGWIEAGRLQLGHRLIQTDGQPAIVIATRREEYPEGVPVYNIEVAGHHTYFVTANATRAPPVWVHNKGKYWNKFTHFNGNKVFQRNDLINPRLIDHKGLTNLQRMQIGRAPIGPDGNSLELHHMLQSQNGPIAEVTQSFHQRYGKTIHINPNTIPSGIDRAAFKKWREQYWKQRANDFMGGLP